MANETDSIASDRLRGCAQIAKFLGENERRVFALLQAKAIPATKELGLWVASKSRLRAHYAESNNTPAKTSA
jgi:hypothetical protein